MTALSPATMADNNVTFGSEVFTPVDTIQTAPKGVKQAIIMMILSVARSAIVGMVTKIGGPVWGKTTALVFLFRRVFLTFGPLKVARIPMRMEPDDPAQPPGAAESLPTPPARGGLFQGLGGGGGGGGSQRSNASVQIYFPDFAQVLTGLVVVGLGYLAYQLF